LINSRLMDYGDLTAETVNAFRSHPDILECWQNYCKYLIVDEYQDTNHAQYMLIKNA